MMKKNSAYLDPDPDLFHHDCLEQSPDRYMVFVDLTKAFDSVGRKGLWSLLAKVGCPEKAINIIRSFHDGMVGRISIKAPSLIPSLSTTD